MEDLNLPLIIASVTALVGVLCLCLAIVALGRSRKATSPGAVLAENQETPAELRAFAAKQLFSAAVMFVLAVVIFIYS